MSKPYNYFLKSIGRAKKMTEVEIDDDGLRDDICRGAAVLAIGALDHYFTSKFSDVPRRHLEFNQPNKALIELLERAGLNTRTALELMVMKRPFRRIRSLVSKSLSYKTTNQTEAIDRLFSALDLKGLTGKAKKKCGRKNLSTRIEKLVSIRNDVSHSAHINSHGNPKKISAEDISARISEVELFVETCENIINDWVSESVYETVSSATD